MTRFISTEKLAKEIKGITAPIANKLIPKLLIRFTIDDKLNQKKFIWCYKLTQRAVASEELVEQRSLAYNTVVSLVRGASVQGQMVHNQEVR